MPANGTWEFPAESSIINMVGIYKIVARGKLDDWFDFGTIEAGVNPRFFNIEYSPFKVTLGEDASFTNCNYHNTSTEITPNYSSKSTPMIIQANASGNVGMTHVHAKSYQEGNSRSWVGINFNVNEGGQANR